MMNIDNSIIERAIESAKCRIYRLKENSGPGCSLAHQKKAEEQALLQRVTVHALNNALAERPRWEGEFIGVHHCPACSWVIGVGQNYCDRCGKKMLWEE